MNIELDLGTFFNLSAFEFPEEVKSSAEILEPDQRPEASNGFLKINLTFQTGINVKIPSQISNTNSNKRNIVSEKDKGLELMELALKVCLENVALKRAQLNQSAVENINGKRKAHDDFLSIEESKQLPSKQRIVQDDESSNRIAVQVQSPGEYNKPLSSPKQKRIGMS